jgi:2-dehydro-3-deoxyphosphogluconate aldolase/(4S)-4-hydroxy-2-oxoglutarate aldolase
VAAPYGHTGVQFIPMGGINADNFATYLEVPLVAAVGLSALSPAELVREGKWEKITKRTKLLVERALSE